MQTNDTTALKNILDYLPQRIKQAIEEYSFETQLPPELVIEMAIAHFLDVDSVTFDDCRIDSRLGTQGTEQNPENSASG